MILERGRASTSSPNGLTSRKPSNPVSIRHSFARSSHGTRLLLRTHPIGPRFGVTSLTLRFTTYEQMLVGPIACSQLPGAILRAKPFRKNVWDVLPICPTRGRLASPRQPAYLLEPAITKMS